MNRSLFWWLKICFNESEDRRNVSYCRQINSTVHFSLSGDSGSNLEATKCCISCLFKENLTRTFLGCCTGRFVLLFTGRKHLVLNHFNSLLKWLTLKTIIYHTRLKVISSAPQTKPNKYDGEVLTVAAADPTRSRRESVFSELLTGRVDVLLLGFRSSVCVCIQWPSPRYIQSVLCIKSWFSSSVGVYPVKFYHLPPEWIFTQLHMNDFDFCVQIWLF